jgi:hypothetical protein
MRIRADDVPVPSTLARVRGRAEDGGAPSVVP